MTNTMTNESTFWKRQQLAETSWVSRVCGRCGIGERRTQDVPIGDYIELMHIAAAGALAIGFAIASTVQWFLKWDPIDALKLVAVAIGFLSAMPNFGALQAVRTSIISCKKNFDFTGLGIGPSTAFEAPMRSILYSYSLFLFYQIVSQILSVAGDATWSVFLTDLALQTAMLTLVASQVGWMYGRAISAFREKKKQLRFFAKFDETLRDEDISLSSLFRSTFVLAIIALLPKFVELLAAR